MAKQPKAATTRLATTVTARYYPTSGATDRFYLDGRLSGRREHRAADITLDREDRGFFLGVFARLSGGEADGSVAAPVRQHLDKIMTEIKDPAHNIDAEINELAECAVSVVGRMALKHDGMRQPYFAGILVRDAELAAVTMGGGCAYLYRNDVLYPLTTDDFPMEAIDFSGKAVDNLDMYSAGVAGTVRYSNIAQLQMDDCLIVCNREVMQALGQREVLRMLYEADDQADAAGMVMTAAAAKLPGTPMQFMIGFVENIFSAERTGRLGLTKSHADTAAFLGLGQTSRSDALFGRPKPREEEWPQAQADEADEPMPALMYTQTDPLQEGPVPERTEPAYFDDHDDEDLFGDEIDAYGRGRRIAFYVIIAAICIACLVLIYQMIFGKPKAPKETDKPGVTTESVETTTDSASPTPSGEQTDPTGGQTQETGSEQSGQETTSGQETSATQPPDGSILARHTVVAGDTPWSIAVKYYGSGSWEYSRLILDANDIDYTTADGQITNAVIRVGDVLVIPVLPD